MTSDAMGNRGAGLRPTGEPAQMNQEDLGRLMRSAVGMNLNSSLGSFKMSYSDGLNGNTRDSGGLGKGSAQATFNSPTVDGMFNFSAAEILGSSGIHNGFSSGVGISNGFSNAGAPMGAGSQKRPATSLSMRMSF
jgi:hypothetical protein